MAFNAQNKKKSFDIESIEERKINILNTGQWSDCMFIVGTKSKEEIKSHRVILAMASPVFETMFFGSLPNQEKKPINVDDIQPTAFKAMLTYIYTEKISFTYFNEVCEIFASAYKYMIRSLVEECKSFIMKHLAPENVFFALGVFSLFEETGLEEKCFRILTTRTKEVINHQSFGDIHKSMLYAILKQDHLNATELDLWKSTLIWSTNECKRQKLEINALNQRKVMQHLLYLFRFLTMTSKEFTNGPALSKILSEQECLSIIMNIISPTVTNMPKYFSTTKVLRR